MDDWERLDGPGVEGSLDRQPHAAIAVKKPDVVAEPAITHRAWEEHEEWAALKARKEASARKEAEESEAKKTREANAYAKSKETLKARLILAKTTS